MMLEKLIAPALAALVLAGPAAAQSSYVPAEQAVAAFADICLDTAPSFIEAESRMARHGLTNRRETGTVFHSSGTLSAKIHSQISPDGVPYGRCSLVMEDPDFEKAVRLLDAELARRGLTALNGPVPTDPGGAIYISRQEGPGGRRLIGIMRDDPTQPFTLLAYDVIQ